MQAIPTCNVDCFPERNHNFVHTEDVRVRVLLQGWQAGQVGSRAAHTSPRMPRALPMRRLATAAEDLGRGAGGASCAAGSALTSRLACTRTAPGWPGRSIWGHVYRGHCRVTPVTVTLIRWRLCHVPQPRGYAWRPRTGNQLLHCLLQSYGAGGCPRSQRPISVRFPRHSDGEFRRG